MKRTSLQIMILAATAAALLAQDQQFPNQQVQEEDGPGRGIARVSLINGDVSTRRGDTGDWVASALNQPVMGEDRLVTGPRSRAEIQFDSSNMVRLGDDTEVRMGSLEQRRYLVMVPRGTVTYRILRDLDADVEISTPSIAVRPTRGGIYRVSVTADGTTEITVRSGEVEVLSPKGAQRLQSGQTMLVRGEVSDPEFQTVGALRMDEFDRWNENRDKELLRSRSYSYVSKDIYGAEELDSTGRWVNSDEYGTVWSPRVDSDWAPYRNGRWVWADYYGWTWVSSDSFGWAPYHYGRWYSDSRYGWCWYPGARSERHFWRPALVAFFGFGSWGNIGWVPLAPYETFRPWYGRGYYGGYRNGGININITNVNISNNYRNARINNGYTTVNSGSFGRGAVQNVRVGRDQIANAGLVRGQVPIAPDRSSTRYNDRGSKVVGNSRDDQKFYSRGQTARVDRVPFETQQQRITEGGRGSGLRNGSGSTDSSFRGTVQGTPRGQSTDNNGGGWRRAGDQNQGSQPNVTQPNVGGTPSRRERSTDGGWDRFGRPNTENSGRGQSQPQVQSAPAATSNDSSRGGWGRFGDPGSRTSDSNSRATVPDNSRGRSRTESAPTRQSAPTMDRGSMPQSNGDSSGNSRSRGSYDSGSSRQRSADPAPGRMSSPVVTERPSRSESRSSGSYSGGGGGRSERNSAPAAAPSAPSPSRGGGGESRGGGGGESRGGGGGESRGGGGSSRSSAGESRGNGGESRGGGGGRGR